MKISKTHHKTRTGIIKRNPKKTSKIPEAVLKEMEMHWLSGKGSKDEFYAYWHYEREIPEEYVFNVMKTGFANASKKVPATDENIRRFLGGRE